MFAVDSGYNTLDIKKYFIDNNIFGVIGYRRYGTKESRKEKSKYEYNKELDIYVEKETGEILGYKGLIDRNGYKKYTNEQKDKEVRSFADSKQNHGYRYAMYRGLKKNQNYTWLICAAQNMKNISIKVDVNGRH